MTPRKPQATKTDAAAEVSESDTQAVSADVVDTPVEAPSAAVDEVTPPERVLHVVEEGNLVFNAPGETFDPDPFARLS